MATITMPRDWGSEVELSKLVTQLRQAGVKGTHQELLFDLQVLPIEDREARARRSLNAAQRSRPLTGKRPLPIELAEALDAGDLSVADLTSDVIAPLLQVELSQYDLSPWEG